MTPGTPDSPPGLPLWSTVIRTTSARYWAAVLGVSPLHQAKALSVVTRNGAKVTEGRRQWRGEKLIGDQAPICLGHRGNSPTSWSGARARAMQAQIVGDPAPVRIDSYAVALGRLLSQPAFVRQCFA